MPFTPAAQSVLNTVAALKDFNERKAQPTDRPGDASSKDDQQPVEGGEIDVDQNNQGGKEKPTPMGD